MVKNWTDAGYEKPMLSEQVNPERSTIFLPLSDRAISKMANDDFLPKDKGPAISLELYSQMSDTEKVALRLVGEQGRVTTALLATQAGVSKLTATRTLKGLMDKGILVWRGRNKTDPAQYYEVVESLQS
ncbi:MarR family transcriptional regulator [Gordonibacter sp.]|uniref:MarR family transcriptional regulator n=1 Tax=Gordonibacter sp. TaxID=1968902 RepID=UPI0025BA9176|nr:MarR family transcriptional regulator [Gordonibacter sp.]